MGCGIHIQAHIVNADGTYTVVDSVPFSNRSYGMFGFLADVRNYSKVPTIAQPRGLPAYLEKDEEYDDGEEKPFGYDYGHKPVGLNPFGSHTRSYLTVQELNEFDYEQTFEDRRKDSGSLPAGEGRLTSFREFLGEGFFRDLCAMEALGVTHIVFGFDN